MRPTHSRVFTILLSSVIVSACADSSTHKQPPPTDLPTYVSESPASNSNSNAGGPEGGGLTIGASAPAPQATTDTTKAGANPPVVPGGRVADVQEADVYRIQDGKLYLLNTYRGFLVYDISDTKKPVRLSRLPVYGYPVEMFVENNTVYALLSDSLYLTQINGQLQFQRRNTSQIVTIDISDPANPKLLQTQDLAGQLREGVSRKIGNSIYVVSYQPSGYWYYGWGPQNGQQPSEQAWVYSFDATTPSNLKQVGQLKVFEGGSTSTYDSTTGESHSRYSSGVTLSATSNAIMVVQNWYTYDYVPPVPTNTSGGTDAGTAYYNPYYNCGTGKNDQQSVVSVVDVSDPAGTIRVAATFTTEGSVGDQFKQTYVYDATANTGTYLGIFARNLWIANGCNYTQQTQNTLEAWNITGDGTATQLSSVDFGKPNETVRGSYFDVDRKVAFAITAQSMDPMYSISFADRNNLKILSAIDGLSGDMDLFRPVENGQYLLAVGRDTGTACAGYSGGTKGDAGVATSWSSQISVSLIDVRDLTKIRLVQRKCLDIANSGWVSSGVTWNLDQAHKMIGLETDGATSVLTVPVSYSVQDNSSNDWYWYRYETAVGIMSWDISQYNDTLPPEQQNVINTHGHFVHPNGEVNRSVIFTQAATSQREMLNISDMYLSLANIQDLDNPTLDSVVEVAAADQAVYRFGDYVVEQVALPSNKYSSQTDYEFRVKKSGGDLDQTPVAASFTVGQVQQVLRHGNQLVLLRAIQDPAPKQGYSPVTYTSQALVYDFTAPAAPKAVGTVTLPADLSPYYSFYRYYCGGMGYYGGYYFGYGQSLASVDEGIAFLIQGGNYVPKTVTSADGGTTTDYDWVYMQNLAFLDLRDPTKPSISEMALTLPHATATSINTASLVSDSMTPAGFYISYQVSIGSSIDPQTQATLYQYANYAQRWERSNGSWVTEEAINIPGSLTRTWASDSGERLLLTRDDVYGNKQLDTYWQWVDNVSLNLLRVVTVNGKSGAERLGTPLSFGDVSPRSMVYDGDRIYMTVSTTPYYYGYYMNGGPVGVGVSSRPGGVATSGDTGGASGGTTTTAPAPDLSDHLAIIDMSQGTLTTTYDQPTELYNLDLMGVQQNKLFVNLQGDGILVVDVTSSSAPKGVSFYRTLGYASGIEFAGTSAYVPADYYGTYHIDMNAPGNLLPP
jgi:hypothetical protein